MAEQDESQCVGRSEKGDCFFVIRSRRYVKAGPAQDERPCLLQGFIAASGQNGFSGRMRLRSDEPNAHSLVWKAQSMLWIQQAVGLQLNGLIIAIPPQL
jgi:hypothetical protein